MAQPHVVTITKTGFIVYRNGIHTKGVTKGVTVELTPEQFKCANAQGFLDESGKEEAAASNSKRPGKSKSPVQETK